MYSLILNYERVDLVAMSAHSRVGPSKIIFGSMAGKVLHHVSIPALLLRPPEIDPENKTNSERVVEVR